MPRGYGYATKIPRAHETELRGIWERAGRSEFLYRLVADCLESPGIVMRLKGYGFIVDLGKVISESGGGHTKLWKLSAKIADLCEQEFGKVNDDREKRAKADIIEFRAHVYKYHREYSTLDRSETDRVKLNSIFDRFGPGPWSAKQVYRELQINMQGGILMRWKKEGKIKVAGEASRQYLWRITDPELLARSKATSLLEVQV